MVLANQGLLGIAFFEATASIILLVLFLLFRRDHQAGYFRFWLTGWCCFTFSSLCEVAVLVRHLPGFDLGIVFAPGGPLRLLLVAVGHRLAGAARGMLSSRSPLGLSPA